MSETSPAATIDLNKPFHYLSENWKQLFRSMYLSRENKEVVHEKFKQFFEKLPQKGPLFLFKIWCYDSPLDTVWFNSAFIVFMQELMKCKFETFHKFRCFFKSPTRLNYSGASCAVFKNPLIKLKEICLKIQTSTPITPREKLDWIELLFKEVKSSANNTNQIFKLDKPNSANVEFSIDNLAFSQGEYNFIGIECSDCYSDQALEQLFYTIPVIFLKQDNPKNVKGERQMPRFICFTFDDQRMILIQCLVIYIHAGIPRLDYRLVELELNIEGLASAFAIISCHINNINTDKGKEGFENFIKEGKVLASLKKQNNQNIESFYQSIFATMSSRKTAIAPSEEHKKNVKQRSQAILKDITNILPNSNKQPPSNKNIVK